MPLAPRGGICYNIVSDNAKPCLKERAIRYEIRYRRIRAGFIRISASVMKAADA